MVWNATHTSCDKNISTHFSKMLHEVLHEADMNLRKAMKLRVVS